jgi:uracil phosphoribosyltransferase
VAGIPAGPQGQVNGVTLWLRQLQMTPYDDVAGVDQPVRFLSAGYDRRVRAADQNAEREAERYLHDGGQLDDLPEGLVPVITAASHSPQLRARPAQVCHSGGRAGTLPTMQTTVADHPLIAHKLTALRDSTTDAPTFRRLAYELTTLLGYEATRHVRVERVSVTTPVGTADGVRLARPAPLIVPILRAGIGLLDGMAGLLPLADVGFVGLVRDEETLQASTYATRLPADLAGRETFILDPMLATGGSMETVVRMLLDRGAAAVTAVCLLAAPEGLARLAARFPDEPGGAPVRVVTGSVDTRLNDKGYILPGLGDAGDRLFGTI